MLTIFVLRNLTLASGLSTACRGLGCERRGTGSPLHNLDYYQRWPPVEVVVEIERSKDIWRTYKEKT